LKNSQFHLDFEKIVFILILVRIPFMRSRFRTFFLIVLMTVLFVWVGGILGGRQGAIIAFVLAGVMNFGGYWFSDRILSEAQSHGRTYRIKLCSRWNGQV